MFEFNTMLLLAKVQLHDHPSVFGVAEFFAAIAAELPGIDDAAGHDRTNAPRPGKFG